MRLHFEETKHTVTRAVLCECGRKFPSGTSGTYYLHRYLFKRILLLFGGVKIHPGSDTLLVYMAMSGLWFQQSLTTSQQNCFIFEKSNKQKNFSKNMFSVGVLIRIRRSFSRGMKPRIRISTKMSWIRNTDQYGKSVKLINFFLFSKDGRTCLFKINIIVLIFIWKYLVVCPNFNHFIFSLL
jgi:hypothetical protein